jgi:pilus assembly protein CpaB
MGRRTLLLITSILVAAVGTALVALYVRGADERAQQAEELYSVLIADRAIGPDETIEAIASTAFRYTTYPKKLVPDDAYAGSDTGLKALLSDHRDDKPRTRILVGQVIQKSMFGQAQDTAAKGVSGDKLGATFSLADPNRVAGLVGPGSEVAVYGIFDEGKGDDKLVKVLISKAMVIKVGAKGVDPQAQSTADKTAEAVPNTIVALDLTPDQVLKLTLAQSAGELYLALRGSDLTLSDGGTLTYTELVNR